MPLWFQGLKGYCLTARPLSVILIMVYQPSLGLPPSGLLRVRQIELDLRAASPLQQLFLKSVESLARLVHHQKLLDHTNLNDAVNDLILLHKNYAFLQYIVLLDDLNLILLRYLYKQFQLDESILVEFPAQYFWHVIAD